MQLGQQRCFTGEQRGDMRDLRHGLWAQRGAQLCEVAQIVRRIRRVIRRQQRVCLREHRFIGAVGAVQLQVDRVCAARQHRDAQRKTHTVDRGHRLAPDDIAQGHSGSRAGARRNRQRKCSAQCFQHQQRRQRAVGERCLSRIELCEITMFFEVGRVAVYQRVQHRRLGHSGCVHRRRRDPIAFTRERIGRQRHQPRRDIVAQPAPVDLHAFGPQRRQWHQRAFGDQAFELHLECGILGMRNQCIALLPGVADMDAVAGRTAAGQQCLQRHAQCRQSVDDEAHPLVHRLAADLQGMRQIARVDPIAFAIEEGEQITDARFELFRAARRQRHQPQRISARRRTFGGDILFQHDMRIRTAGAERGHPGDARQHAAIVQRTLPRAQILRDHERCAREVDVRIEHLRVQRWHDAGVAHLQQHLGHAGDARGRFAVTDVRLGRADQAIAGVVALRRAAFMEGFGERGDFDRVAESGTGAVRFDITDMARIDAGLAQRAADHLRLRLRIGHRVTVGLAAMVQRTTADHTIDMIAVALGLGQAFEHGDAHAFARNITIAAFAEALAVAIAGDKLTAAEHRVLVGMDADVDAAGQRQRGAAQAQVLAGQMQRGQRRRAHGVERQTGAVQIEEIRDAVGDACEAAGQVVFAVHHAGIHADLAGKTCGVRHLQRGAGVAGVFDRHPRMLQEQPLLRIDAARLTRRDIEEARVELVRAFDEAAPFAEVRAFDAAVFAVPGLPIPARSRYFDDAVATVAQIAPERIEIGRLRIAAAQADDRDGFMRNGFMREGRGCRGVAGLAGRGEKAIAATAGRQRRRSTCGRRFRGRRSERRRHRRRNREHAGERRRMRTHEVRGQFVDAQILEEQGLGQRTKARF